MNESVHQAAFNNMFVLLSESSSSLCSVAVVGFYVGALVRAT
jgi:hypothetical protein